VASVFEKKKPKDELKREACTQRNKCRGMGKLGKGKGALNRESDDIGGTRLVSKRNAGRAKGGKDPDSIRLRRVGRGQKNKHHLLGF